MDGVWEQFEHRGRTRHWRDADRRCHRVDRGERRKCRRGRQRCFLRRHEQSGWRHCGKLRKRGHGQPGWRRKRCRRWRSGWRRERIRRSCGELHGLRRLRTSDTLLRHGEQHLRRVSRYRELRGQRDATRVQHDDAQVRRLRRGYRLRRDTAVLRHHHEHVRRLHDHRELRQRQSGLQYDQPHVRPPLHRQHRMRSARSLLRHDGRVLRPVSDQAKLCDLADRRGVRHDEPYLRRVRDQRRLRQRQSVLRHGEPHVRRVPHECELRQRRRRNLQPGLLRHLLQRRSVPQLQRGRRHSAHDVLHRCRRMRLRAPNRAWWRHVLRHQQPVHGADLSRLPGADTVLHRASSVRLP